MKIKKFAQCCLVVEVGGRKILTDPGSYSTDQNSLIGIDAVVITHEHGDHFHAESVRAIVKNNPAAVIIANSSVGKKLDELGITHVIVEGRDKMKVGEVMIEAFDWRHEEIFEERGQVQNTAYLITGGSAGIGATGVAGAQQTFLLPGDAYCDPGAAAKVDILALPVAGPWCRIPDALRYAIKVKPRAAFPVHDGALKDGASGFLYQMVEQVLKDKEITFSMLAAGSESEF
jgi:L-ascorbate metabolism protein UlaG (beta-lactamase superfamily)